MTSNKNLENTTLIEDKNGVIHDLANLVTQRCVIDTGDTGSYIVTLGKKLDKKWHRHGDGAVIDADQIHAWATRITVVRRPS